MKLPAAVAAPSSCDSLDEYLLLPLTRSFRLDWLNRTGGRYVGSVTWCQVLPLSLEARRPAVFQRPVLHVVQPFAQPRVHRLSGSATVSGPR
jgi:hypothetical protein